MPERTDEAEFVETVGHASPSGGALLRYERPPPTPTYGREPRDQQRPTLSVCCGRGAWHAGEANGIVSFSFKILHSKLGDGGRMRLGIVAQGERGSMDYALWFCPYSGIFSEAGHCLAAERDTGKQGEPVMQGSLARGKAATAAQVDVQADTLRNELRFSVVEADGYRHPWNVAVIRKKPVPLPAIFAPVARLGRPGDAVELSRVQVYLPGAVLREQLCQPALGVLGGEMERALGLPDPSIATSELAAARAKLAEARDVQSQAERGSGCHFVWLDAEALRKSRDTMPRLLPKQVLQQRHPEWLHTEVLTLEDACMRTHAFDHVAISHRWDERETPDPSGGQLEAVREYLEARPHITRVWIECVDEIARTLRNIAPSAPRMASSASPTAMADASCSSSHSAWSLRTADGLWWLLIATAGRKQPPTPSADTPRSSARGAASAACRSRSRSLTLPTPTCAPTPSARPSS